MDESKGDSAPLIQNRGEPPAAVKPSSGCGCCAPDVSTFELAADSAQMNVIAGLRKQISAPFVAESTRILRELGKVTLDIDDMPATGPEWKTIGFQGMDPTTDIRGAGIYGLESLVKLLRQYPYFRDLCRQSEAEYPFAVSALNVTRMLSCHFGLTNTPAKFCPCCGAKIAESTNTHALIDGILGLLEGDRNAFFSIYVAAMVILDSAWKKRKAEPGFTLLQYNEVMATTRKSIVYLLEQQPYNCQELLAEACVVARVPYSKLVRQ